MKITILIFYKSTHKLHENNYYSSKVTLKDIKYKTIYMNILLFKFIPNGHSTMLLHISFENTNNSLLTISIKIN